ncbi:hypothetical protein V9T40_000462 [Parthenolecanium corni]|uniref:Uncharacterized protein n=1 Tax=Parthenolecanium corni TaxID=536013 RepID=A0AAN9T9D8_9HEMI
MAGKAFTFTNISNFDNTASSPFASHVPSSFKRHTGLKRRYNIVLLKCQGFQESTSPLPPGQQHSIPQSKKSSWLVHEINIGSRRRDEDTRPEGLRAVHQPSTKNVPSVVSCTRSFTPPNPPRDHRPIVCPKAN